MTLWAERRENIADKRPATRAAMDWVHVPTPGDHYSAATGSAVMTVIYEFSRVHERKGGRTRVIVTRGTRHDYPVGDCVVVDAASPPAKWKRGLDMIVGRAGLGRPFGKAAYRRHAAALPPDFSGVLFVHNNPVAVGMFKRRFPAATVCLWAQNELFRTYANREAMELARAADRLICCSQYIADEMATHVGRADAVKLRVVHSGVDTDRFLPADRLAVNDPVVLFVGRVIPEKGPDLLIRAAAKLVRAGLRLKVRIVGSSNFNSGDPLTAYEKQLRSLAAPLGRAVEFQPFVDRNAVREEYRRADVSCVPSNWNEPLSLTISESMASGVATVASRRGGIPEVGGDAVLYFDPPDVEGLAAQLERLISNPAERWEWGRKARRRAIEVDWQRQYVVLEQAVR